MENDYYFDFKVAPYALPQVCEALHWNGVKDACLTLEDGEIHIRWKRDVNRFVRERKMQKCDNPIGTNPMPE